MQTPRNPLTCAVAVGKHIGSDGPKSVLCEKGFSAWYPAPKQLHH